MVCVEWFCSILECFFEWFGLGLVCFWLGLCWFECFLSVLECFLSVLSGCV